MELSYNTTAADYLALLKYHLERSILGRQFARFAWIAISALAWASVVLPYLKFGVIDVWLVLRAMVAAGLTVGFPVFYGWYNDSVFRQLINEKTVRGLAGATTLVATGDFIEQRTPTTVSRARWRDIDGIASAQNYDYISLAPLVTIAVPATAFADGQSRRAFQEQIAHWLDAARAELANSSDKNSQVL